MQKLHIKRLGKRMFVEVKDDENNIYIEIADQGVGKWMFITQDEAKKMRDFLNDQLDEPYPPIEIQVGVENVKASFKDGKFVVEPNPEIITTDWLSKEHRSGSGLELDLQDAKSLLKFLQIKGVYRINDYQENKILYNEWASTPEPTPPNQINQCVHDYNRHSDLDWANNTCSDCGKPLTPVQ